MEVALGECTLRLTSYGVLQPGSALGRLPHIGKLESVSQENSQRKPARLW